jgi:hypothetical protein
MTFVGRGNLRLHRTVPTIATLAALAMAACSGGDKSAGPVLPGNPPSNPQLKRAAFVMDVDMRTRQVKITAPTTTLNSLSHGATGSRGLSANSADNPIGSQSIVAGDVVNLTTSNFSASPVGQFTPGKVRVKFDVNITNRLASVQLITPTFPTPPAGVIGVLLFPFSTNVTTTTGGTSTGGDGTTIIIDLPNYGQVAPSTDWDGDGTPGSGAPFNFFNDAACGPSDNDCYRWSAFASPLAAGATSGNRTVGFDIDPTVANFRARLIVAADLANSGPAPTGTIAGNVTSPQRGNLSGVTVTANAGGLTGTTDAAGNYSIATVATGPKTISLSNLPAGCTAPASQNTTVNSGATSTVNFSVTCTVAAGTVTGTITRSGPGSQSLAAVTAVATPGAAGTSTASATITGGASFSYSIPNVQIGSGAGAGAGSVALGNLPAGCSATPASGAYTGLTNGGSAAGPSFDIACIVPPAFYQLTNSWSAISAGKVTLTITFDPTTLNDPAINGAAADDISGFTGNINFGSSRLSISSAAGNNCVKSATSPFDAVFVFNPAFATNTIRIVGVASGAGATTPTVIATCTFNVNAGAAASVTTATTGLQVASFNGGANTPITANTQINEGTLAIP